MKHLAVLSIFISGCGLTIHSDPVKVDPIQVNHVVQIDLASLTSFYNAYCDSILDENRTQEEFEQCVKDGVDTFYSAWKFTTEH